jgi:DOPA 4,5-dioxygenase
MFELHIPANMINYAKASIDELREGLSVLIHPVQQDELDAHTNSAIWLGTKLDLKLDALN